VHDVVIAGAGLAGSAAAALYGRRGLDVVLLERDADPAGHKTVCTTFIQASATPVIQRLGLAPRLDAAEAVHNGIAIWTRWGWIRPVPDGQQTRRSPYGYNVRRETLDPMLRDLAAETPGVELRRGFSATGLLRDGDRVTGVVARERDGTTHELRARLVVGADGRASRVAELAGLEAKQRPHGRIAYMAHYRGVQRLPDQRSQMWMLDPDVAYIFPHDDGVTILAAMPSKARLDEFRADPEAALLRTFEGLPDAPPMTGIERVSKVIGRVDMTNLSRPPVGAGLALAGDAAMASDPLWGVGCGFALQSAEWLVDATAEALAAGTGLDRALSRYARIHRRRLTGHHLVMCDFATARQLNALERLIFSAAARDAKLARHVEAFGTRHIGPGRFLAPPVLARAAAVNARHARARAQREPTAAAA
jgi:flavin-dependent dehydrogenase